MDLDKRVMEGCLKTETEKGRYAEIIIREMFDNKGIDLSGKYCINYLDGICPGGQTYEVKSSRLQNEIYWVFGIGNHDKDDDKEAIQWYYFVAMNKDYTKLIYMWRVPGDRVEGTWFQVGISSGYKFNVENMKEYDITDKFKKIIIDKDNEMLKEVGQLTIR